jgi:argininosuccinate lyase
VRPQAGRVRRTGGVADAAAVPGVVDVAIAARPGQCVGGTGSFLDRIGHVIAAGPSPDAARAAAEAGLALLVVDVEACDAAEAASQGQRNPEPTVTPALLPNNPAKPRESTAKVVA